MKILKMLLAALLALTPSMATGQNGYFTDRAVGVSQFNGFSGLVPISYGQVRVCTSIDINTSTTPCPDLATVFNLAGSPITVSGGGFGQVTTDVVGRFNFQTLPGSYWIQVAASGSNTPQLSYAITVSPVSLTPSSLLLGSNNIWTGTNAFNATGVFTNTQQNDNLTATLGTFNFGTRYAAQQGGNFATEAFAAGLTCSGTVHQCNGVGAYVQSTSVTPFPVALYGQAEIGVVNGKAYGLNTVSADALAFNGTVVGAEIDVNVANASSLATGLSLQGAWAAQPTSATAFSFGSLNGVFHWQNGLVFGGNFTNNICAGGGTCGSIVLNQSGTGAGQDSQQILFNSSSRGSLLRALDSNGFLFHNVGYTAPVFASSGTNPSSSGTLRLVKTEAIGWRNNANSADDLMGQDANDHLTFAGLTVAQLTTMFKTGSGAGNYTAANTTYANVDTTNLCQVVTIPVGSKLIIQATGTGLTSTAATNFLVSVADIGTTCAAGGITPLQEIQIGAPSTGNPITFSLAWVVNGDGAAHAISMQAKTTVGADAWLIANSSTSLRPSMILTLTPSN